MSTASSGPNAPLDKMTANSEQAAVTMLSNGQPTPGIVEMEVWEIAPGMTKDKGDGTAGKRHRSPRPHLPLQEPFKLTTSQRSILTAPPRRQTSEVYHTRYM
jgi:hypothetical protein